MTKQERKNKDFRREYVKRLKLTYKRPSHKLVPELMEQLDRCADDSARRLILEVSR